MTAGRSPVAGRIAGLALRIMPPGQREWAEAMVHETGEIEDGPSAVAFALGCVKGALFAAARDRAARVTRMLASPSTPPGDQNMEKHPSARARDPIVGILCAVCAVGLGVAYMVTGGAPQRLIVINLAALLMGLGLCLWLAQWRLSRDGRINMVAPVLGAALLGTAIFGLRADGAARWVDVAGLVVQPGLLFAPLILGLHARRGDVSTTTGLALAIVAMAAQPDRAMSGVVLGALALLAMTARRRRDVALALAAAVGFGVAVFRPDRGGISPFVDQILFTSFDLHPLVGAGLVLGVMLLVVPGLFQATRGREATTGLVFCAVWSLVVVAALMGNYPTPLVGYGGSAIVGYLLSLAVLGPIAEAPGRVGAAIPSTGEDVAGDARIVTPT